MTEFLDDLPAWLIFVVMFSIGMTRSAGYYALGRLSRGRTGSAWAERVARAGGEFLPEAERRVASFGPRAVTMAYPFYGLSGATQIVAGMTRMHIPGFAAAVGVGAAVWSLMLAIVGVAAVQAIVAGWTMPPPPITRPSPSRVNNTPVACGERNTIKRSCSGSCTRSPGSPAGQSGRRGCRRGGRRGSRVALRPSATWHRRWLDARMLGAVFRNVGVS